jgi:hypothetical protein
MLGVGLGCWLKTNGTNPSMLWPKFGTRDAIVIIITAVVVVVVVEIVVALVVVVVAVSLFSFRGFGGLEIAIVRKWTWKILNRRAICGVIGRFLRLTGGSNTPPRLPMRKL